MTERTDKKFESDMRALRERLLKMAGKVEEMIASTTRALVERDSSLAEEIVAADRDVDHLEIENDEHCLEILALHQPAATDLRFIRIALKTVTDLERIGDECVNIAERALELNREPQLKPLIDIPRMAGIAQDMVAEALDALVQGDADKALAVCLRDDEVDALNHQIFRELVSYMTEDPRTITRASALIAVAKHLERIADHATNIAEMVVFLVRGIDIRHRTGEARVDGK